jgi:uncharacterized protein YidB (DUF937 family)
MPGLWHRRHDKEYNVGLLDQLGGGGLLGGPLGSMLGGGQNAGLAKVVVGMLTESQSGGLTGLVQSFTRNGLGEIVSSWVSTGQNLPISPQQIEHGLGSGQVQQIAQQAGVAPDAAKALLAQLLPLMVDKLTPNGKIPDASALEGLLGGLLGGANPKP